MGFQRTDMFITYCNRYGSTLARMDSNGNPDSQEINVTKHVKMPIETSQITHAGKSSSLGVQTHPEL